MPDHDRTRYLRVMGRLRADRQLTLRLGYLTATPPWSDVDGESALRAEVFDDQGALLGSFPLRLSAMCAEGQRGGVALAPARLSRHTIRWHGSGGQAGGRTNPQRRCRGAGHARND